MAVNFSWVEYEYHEPVEEDAECADHTLCGKLSKAALCYLTTERYFRDGTNWKAPIPEYQTTEEDDFRAALQKDWEDEAGY